ncbi:MAG: hypothetical protein ACE5I7_04730 [Candidatus Binatia bacterium]
MFECSQHTQTALCRNAVGLLFGTVALVTSACGNGSNSSRATTPPPPTIVLSPTPSPTTPAATPTTIPAAALRFTRPVAQQLSLAGAVEIVLAVPRAADPGSLVVQLDGVAVRVDLSGGEARGTVSGVAPGSHLLTATVQLDATQRLEAQATFETVALQHPDQCDVLDNSECLLPYPSSRFLEPADTPTGWRLSFPAIGMPVQGNSRLPTAPYAALDGFSPTVQILMHFAGGVDPAVSNASRLLPETRTYSLRSLDADSPTVLVDADTGERILHFIEPDARAADNPDRQVLFLRPGESLTPGHRYIVAVRNLMHSDGTPVTAAPAFAALRDGRPTDIDAIESRRAHFEALFGELDALGVARSDLLLAFDFVVQSDQVLTSEMLSMRDQAFAWLAQQATAGTRTFRIDQVVEHDCTVPGTLVWRQVEGTYEVPLFLTSDPVADPVTPGTLTVDAAGAPVQNGLTNPPFTIAIPCGVLADGGTPMRPLIAGHDLFGTGRGFISDLTNAADLDRFDFVAGATDWRGLSGPDIDGAPSFVADEIVLRLRNFPALPDRLRQGQLNTLVLARMMKTAVFNVDPAFQTPTGVGVLAGPRDEEFYFGASLGGIMGLMFSALSPDIVNAHVDVPAFNFSILLQRATPFLQFQDALTLTGITDPIDTALLIDILEELWDRGESAGYATHITSNPLPGTNAKRILMTAAFLDQQVSNQGTEIAARTLGLPSLVGSLQTDRPLIPDLPGPLPSALVMYDTGSFDPSNPAHARFIPPLANLQGEPTRCDPHTRQAFIPAALEQQLMFLQPGGEIVNFCNRRCDAGDPSEIPFGASQPCEPQRPRDVPKDRPRPSRGRSRTDASSPPDPERKISNRGGSLDGDLGSEGIRAQSTAIPTFIGQRKS